MTFKELLGDGFYCEIHGNIVVYDEHGNLAGELCLDGPNVNNLEVHRLMDDEEAEILKAQVVEFSQES